MIIAHEPPGPWQSFTRRKDNIGLSVMEVKQKWMKEQLLFESYLNTLSTVSTAAAGAAGGPAPSTGGGGTPSYTALTDANISTAKDLWFSDQAAAEAEYGPIGQWNVTAVTSMRQLFLNQSTFNEDISGWDVSNVTSLEGMFKEASAFNQEIGGWDVSSVTNMGEMFYNDSAFDQDLGSWDMSSVTTPAFMFLGATSFNNGGSDSINNWDMTGVPNGAGAGLSSMFQNATSFNQPLGNWDVTEVKNFADIFNGATLFNQDLSSWTPTKMTGVLFGVIPMGFTRGFLNTAMSTANYDALLIAWSALTFTDVNIPFAMNQTTQYSAGAAATARGVLTGAPNNWTITDGGQA